MQFNTLRRSDPALPALTLIIMAAGLAVLYSASHNFGSQFLVRQLLWIGLGTVFISLILFINYYRIAGFSYYLYGFNILLLIAVILFGSVRMGAKRWLSFGGVSFQPSEFAKITVILALARYLGDIDRSDFRPGHFFAAAMIAFFPVLLIMKQPDLGTSLIFFPILLVMLYWKGVDIRYILSLIFMALAAAPIGWHLLKDYQKSRLLVFINPNMEPLGAGYTIIQSKIAIGSGWLFGKGWLAGTQNQLNFLPERHTDFIFSVAGEEWGFMGSCILVLLYLMFIKKVFRIAESSSDGCAGLTAAGIMTMFLLHVVINIAMTMGLMPVVGLPIPFISYGGSWMVASMIAVGILLSIDSLNRA